jgi:hypothetical protein
MCSHRYFQAFLLSTAGVVGVELFYNVLYYYQRSTCFGQFFRPSSGAYKTVCAALGIFMLSCCLPLVWNCSTMFFIIISALHVSGGKTARNM